MKHRLAFGLKIKRWLLAGFLGLIIEMLGMLLVFNSLLDDSNLEWERKFYCQITYASTSLGIWGQWPQVLVFPLLGVGLVLLGFYRSSRSLLIFLAPNLRRKELVERAYQKKYLQKGPKITAIGGGTGLSTVLRGLKEYTENITAVVSVADDGGSSGKLRNELGMLPPGDIRNCLAALADQESLLDSLFQYRFSEQHLSGHCMGNLLLAALNDMSGDLEQAIHSLSQIFAIRGQVLPVTLEPVSLGAEFMDGEIVLGESVIPEQKKPIKRVFLEPSFCRTLPEVLKAIKESDLILLAPGSLYTSLLPNLLVHGIREALAESTAVKVYVCNIMTQQGETNGYTASRHVQEIQKVSGNILDYVLVNTAEMSKEMREIYRKESSTLVKPDLRKLEKLGVKVIAGDFIKEGKSIRHDTEKIARIVNDLAQQNWQQPKRVGS